MEIERRVHQVVAEALHLPLDSVTLDTPINQGDSLERVEHAILLEVAFENELQGRERTDSDDECARYYASPPRTVGELVAFVQGWLES